MGLPALTIIFKSAANTAIKRAERGIVGMIVKDSSVPETNPSIIYTEKDIPTGISAANKEQVQLALVGNVNTPRKIVLYVLDEGAEDYTDALTYFEFNRVNWLVCPTAQTDTQTTAIVEWVKAQRKDRNKIKAVLSKADSAADEGIINYATDNVSMATVEKTYTAEQFCSRIAGLFAGTPLTRSATFTVLTDVASCTNMTREEAGAAVDAGKLVLFDDGTKVKIARAVNSLTEPGEGKNDTWKKVKIIETMDTIHDDLILAIEDNYIGKYPNTYNNKNLVKSAIMDYFDEFVYQGVLDSYTIDFDLESIETYLIENKGLSREDVEAMDELSLKKYNTDDKIFFAATLSIVDAIEDITLNITV